MNDLILEDRIILIRAEDVIIEELKKEFTFQDTSKTLTSGQFDKSKIKNVCLLHKKNEYYWLFSGFLKKLLGIIKQNNWQFNLKQDLRTKPEIIIPEFSGIVPGFVLYDHQIEAANYALKNKIGIIKLPTSSGKSIIIAAILKILNMPFLLLVNKKGLADQLWNDFISFGINCGICHSEKKIFKDSMVCTIGSVYKINLENIKVVVVDEVHNSSASQFQDFFKKFLPPIRLGFSATPEGNSKYNFALIRQFFGEIIYTLSPKILLDKGIIAEPFIYFVNNICDPEINWPMTEQKQVIDNKNRNGIIADFVNNNKNYCFLILVERMEHGKILNNLIDDSVYLDGNDSIKRRNEIKNEMEDDVRKVVITTRIWNEGISVKAIQILINASARKSSIQSIQKLGRALRIKEGKTKTIIIDFNDFGNGFLNDQSHLRKKIWKKEGYKNIKDIEDLSSIDINQILS